MAHDYNPAYNGPASAGCRAVGTPTPFDNCAATATPTPPRVIEALNSRANNVAAGIHCALENISDAFHRLGVPHGQNQAANPVAEENPGTHAFGELSAHLSRLEDAERWLIDLSQRLQQVV